jgi:hypothetical protein
MRREVGISTASQRSNSLLAEILSKLQCFLSNNSAKGMIDRKATLHTPNIKKSSEACTPITYKIPTAISAMYRHKSMSPISHLPSNFPPFPSSHLQKVERNQL